MNSHGHEKENEPLHFVTPLKYSKALSKLIPDAAGVYIKMENCQPSGSYKIRGIGRLAQKVRQILDGMFMLEKYGRNENWNELM
jgi:threonine dehydratase